MLYAFVIYSSYINSNSYQVSNYKTSLYISTDYGNNWYLYNKTIYIGSSSSYINYYSCISGDGNLVYFLDGQSFTRLNITSEMESNPFSLPTNFEFVTASYNGSILLGTNLNIN